MKSLPSAKPAALLLTFLAVCGCRLPGKPGPNFVPQRPDAVSNFDALYSQNCQACHGVHGQGGMAVSLASPAYIAYAGEGHIAQITANGISGSLMPAFAKSQGGLLTDQQIRILAAGIAGKWANPAALGGATPPPYESTAHGDAARGQTLYQADCLRCHAPGPASILSPTYLALISDGGLRTLMVTGKPAEGMPDWRAYPGGALGRGLDDQQLADLVAFLSTHRTPAPGQPFPNQQGMPQPGNATSAAHEQQQLAVKAGPATGGPKQSTSPAPPATPRHPESVKP